MTSIQGVFCDIVATSFTPRHSGKNIKVRFKLVVTSLAMLSLRYIAKLLLLRSREYKAVQAKEPITFRRTRAEILFPGADIWSRHAVLKS